MCAYAHWGVLSVTGHAPGCQPVALWAVQVVGALRPTLSVLSQPYGSDETAAGAFNL